MGCGAQQRVPVPMGIGVRVPEPCGSNGCLLAAGPVPAGHSVAWGCGELVEGCGVWEGEPALGTAGTPLASREGRSYHVGPPCQLGAPCAVPVSHHSGPQGWRRAERAMSPGSRGGVRNPRFLPSLPGPLPARNNAELLPCCLGEALGPARLSQASCTLSILPGEAEAQECPVRGRVPRSQEPTPKGPEIPFLGSSSQPPAPNGNLNSGWPRVSWRGNPSPRRLREAGRAAVLS